MNEVDPLQAVRDYMDEDLALKGKILDRLTRLVLVLEDFHQVSEKPFRTEEDPAE